MRELLERAGFRIRQLNRADCPYCEGHSIGTVSFKDQVWHCFRCNRSGNLVMLARQVGLLRPGERAGPAAELEVRRHVVEGLANFRVIECALSLEVCEELRRLEKAKAGSTARLAAIGRGEPERWPGEETAAWETLACLPNKLRRAEAACYLLSFGRASWRLRFVLRPADREELIRGALEAGAVGVASRLKQDPAGVEKFLLQHPAVLDELHRAVLIEPAWPTPGELERIWGRSGAGVAMGTDWWKGPGPFSEAGAAETPQVHEAAKAGWPDPPAPAAYHGVAGQFVSIIDPHTEADAVGLLSQLLAYFGNAIGRRAHFRVEASQHYSNIFVVLVGVTSRSRKGSSEAHVRGLFAEVDPVWASHCIQSGLSSGEGLIWHVRDPISRHERTHVKGQPVQYRAIEADPGISDKRMLVREPEMASVLRVQERQGATLSSVIREAWDRGDLSMLTKNSPARATGAHVTIVGHVTRDELLRYLTLTETANGFANRFLWLCVRRSKVLPEGGQLDADALRPVVDAVKKAVDFARSVGEVRRDDAARTMWREVYPGLSEGPQGLYGAVLSRAEAQVLRLSLLYALLDCSRVIGPDHLAAAIGLWDYAEASARYIFGDAVGDPIADIILKALRVTPGGLSRTEISNLFSRNQMSSQIERALETLEEHGLARCTRTKMPKGPPLEVWSYEGRTRTN